MNNAQTMRDVARRAGVSTATVSRALHKPEVVAPATLARVRTVVAAAGYTPNSLARSLREKRTRSIIVVVPDIANPFFGEIFHGIDEVALERGFSVLVGNAEQDPARERAYAEFVAGRRADGMLLLNGRLPPSLPGRRGSARAALPLVLACERIPGRRLPTVRIDNVQAAAVATRHLIALGHRRIAHVTGPLDNVHGVDRLAGYRQALTEAGLLADDALIVHGDFRSPSGIAAARHLLALAAPPTAVFCANDEMAFGVIRWAKECGLLVPADLSVVGFDDIVFAGLSDPPLTTIQQPRREIGRQAMTLLIDLLAGAVDLAREIVLPSHLVVRGSTTGPSPARRPRKERP